MKNPPGRRILLFLLIVLLGRSLWPEASHLLVKGEDTALPAEPTGPTVVRLYVKDRDHLNAVAGRLDIWEAHPDQNYVVAAVSPAQYRWLQDLGYQLEVDAEKTSRLEMTAALDPRFYYFDSFYPNANGRYVVNFLHDVNVAYPNLTDLYDIGDAWLTGQLGEHDRDMWVLRITNEDPAYGDVHDKPAFFLFAAVHAREVAVPELAIRYINYLTTGYNGEGGYGQDADVTWLVNHNVAYVLVMQNPDGHWVNEQKSTGTNRRKNMDNDDGCPDPGNWGVDLNRNHSFRWGCCNGSSPDPCYETYRGPGRASEPETQAFQNFFTAVMHDQNGPNGDDEQPPAAPDTTTGIFISLHSYGDLVLWPWGFDAWGPAPNDAQMATIGRKFAYYNGANPSGTIWYDVDGATDDWTYGKFGIPSYTFEVGPEGGNCSGFFPLYGCIDGIDGMPRNFWAENKSAFLYAHKIARTPYMTAYGPDTEVVVVAPSPGFQGMLVDLMATVADHRYGGDPVQPIAAAEYFADAPGEDGTGVPLNPVDGAWGGLSEEVKAVVDTASLAPGKHYLLVHGQNNTGDWGPFTAVFLDVLDPVSAPAIEGHVREADTNAPLGAVVTASGFQADTDPATGYYQMRVISGTYDLSAIAAGYVISTVTGIQAYDYQIIQQDFSLVPLCEVFTDTMESGERNWSHQADQGNDQWTLSTTQSHSPTHAWHIPDGGGITDSYLWNTIPFPIAAGSTLTFWHRYGFEGPARDGAVLEISTDGGSAWTDLDPYITANGYNGTLESIFGNPLGGRRAWVGDLLTWTQVQVDLSSFVGKNAQIRWRVGCGNLGGGTGWTIDDVVLMGSGSACNLVPRFSHFYLPIMTNDYEPSR